MLHKIAVLGERQSVIGFQVLGLSVFPEEDEGHALQTFRRLAKSEQYAIIYVTEALAKALEQEIDRYKDSVSPAVIIIPGRGGSQGLGLQALKQAVERAVGIDILAES